jgi:hypothetical protein
MRKIATALFVVSALALSACGSAETAVAPMTIPVPTTTLSRQQIAQTLYFIIAAEINPLEQAIDDKYPDSTEQGWGYMPAYCGEMGKVYQRSVELLATTVWPPEYQPQITDAITKTALLVELYFTCAGLPGTYEAQHVTNQRLEIAAALSKTGFSTIRGVLGLPIERD